MKNLPLLLLVVVFVWWHLVAKADDEKNSAKGKLPAESEKWNIDFEGFGGTPGDRSRFHLKVSHEGAVEVQTGRKSLGTPTKGKLTPEETHEIYDHVCKIMKTYDQTKKNTGRVMDGWNLTLKLKGDSSEVSVMHSNYEQIEDASPEFKKIRKIINKEFPNVGFPE